MTTKNGYYHFTNFASQDVIATALVVEATFNTTTETYINFVPDAPLPQGMAISGLAAALEPGTSSDPALQAHYFFGAQATSDMSDLDVTYFKK